MEVEERRPQNLNAGLNKGMRKYPVNEDLFHEIDCEQKAYIFGLICGDGYIGSQNNVSIRIIDEYLAAVMRDALNPDKPLHIIKSKNQPIFALDVYSKKLVSDLTRHGCGPRKSLKQTFPKISHDLIHHFVRGYFDADGSVFHANRTWRLAISIIATREFCETLAALLPVPSAIRDRSYVKMSDLRIGKQQDIILFRDWLYNGATIYLQRKKIIFDKIGLDSAGKPGRTQDGAVIRPVHQGAGRLVTDATKQKLRDAKKAKSPYSLTGRQMTFSEISTLIGRDRKTISSYASRHGLTVQEAIDYYGERAGL